MTRLPGKIARALYSVALVSLCACGSADQADRRKPGEKVFHFSLSTAPTSLDPVRSSTLYSNYLVENIFDTLYSYKFLQRPFVLRPALAAAMPTVSADGLVYTIALKRGMRFADSPAFPGGKGREIKAGDVVFSILRHFDPATRPSGTWLWQDRIVGLDDWKQQGSDYTQPVAGLVAVDDYTLRITLLKPYPQLVYTLAMGYSGIVPREAIDYYGREFSVNPVGSGPFRLVSYDSTKAVLVRNQNFRQEPIDLEYEGYDPVTQGGFGLEAIDGKIPPLLDRLEISFIKETSAQWSSFTKGTEIQFTGLPNEQVDRVLAAKDPITLKPEYAEQYHMHSYLEAGFVFSVFNMAFPELGYNDDPERDRRNKALRCAIVKGFDWEARNNSWYSGLGRIFPGIIPPTVPEFDPDLSYASVTYDPEGARRLLESNGWTPENLPVIEGGALPGPVSRLFYEQFRSWMKRIGYPQAKVKLKTYATFGDLVKAWRNSELPYIAKGWGLDYPDAENTLQLFYGPNGSPGSNDGNYNNPEYDRLFRQAAVMLPSPERTAIYRQMNKMIIDDCAAISGLSRVGISLWHKDVIMYPERSFISGRALMYVDLVAAPED